MIQIIEKDGLKFLRVVCIEYQEETINYIEVEELLLFLKATLKETQQKGA